MTLKHLILWHKYIACAMWLLVFFIRCGASFISITGPLKAFIMFPLNHQQLLKTFARNDSARFLGAFPVSTPRLLSTQKIRQLWLSQNSWNQYERGQFSFFNMKILNWVDYKLGAGVVQQCERLEAQNLLLFSLPTCCWVQKNQGSARAPSLVAFLARKR